MIIRRRFPFLVVVELYRVSVIYFPSLSLSLSSVRVRASLELVPIPPSLSFRPFFFYSITIPPHDTRSGSRLILFYYNRSPCD